MIKSVETGGQNNIYVLQVSQTSNSDRVREGGDNAEAF